jgi:hypothetical protein
MFSSITNFELTLYIDRDEFDDIFNEADRNATRKGYNMHEVSFGYVDDSLIKKGIGVAFHSDKKKKKIRIAVYPSLLLGGNLSDLWKPSNDNISQVCDKLEKIVASYFRKDYSLMDFALNKVCFAADLDIGDRERVCDYIKILHSIRRVKCFTPLKYDKEKGDINKESCFWSRKYFVSRYPI